MAQVPRHTRTRLTHARVERSTHTDNAYDPALSGAEQLYSQVSVDQESQVTTAGIAPGAHLTGAVENQPLNDVPATVVIDETGLTVRDGSFILEDEFGRTVMVASGFTGSWVTSGAFGVYNALFSVGADFGVPLSTGRTADLPYWFISKTVGPVATRVADAAWPGGTYVKCTFTQNGDYVILTSDRISVVPKRWYAVKSMHLTSGGGSAVKRVEASITWFTEAGGLISTTDLDFAENYIGTLTDYPFGGAYSPVNASYARLNIKASVPSGWASGAEIRIGNASLIRGTKSDEIDSDGNLKMSGASFATEVFVGGQLDVGAGSASALSAIPALGDPQVYVHGYLEAQGDAVFLGAVNVPTNSSTPTINGGGSATFSNRTCRWSRVGKFVSFRISFVVTANGSGATTVTVTGTGLPPHAAGAGTRVVGDRAGVGPAGILGRVSTVGSEATISQIVTMAPATVITITGADLVNGAGYALTGTYEAV